MIVDAHNHKRPPTPNTSMISATNNEHRAPAAFLAPAMPADVLCYMDVDLSTDLRALLPLVAGLVSGHNDVAIGTRLAPGSRVVRGRERELISRAYNRLLRVVPRARFSDAQCGFKAVSAHAARTLLAEARDDGRRRWRTCAASRGSPCGDGSPSPRTSGRRPIRSDTRSADGDH